MSIGRIERTPHKNRLVLAPWSSPQLPAHTIRTLAPAASLRRLPYHDATRRGWAYAAGLVLENRATQPYRGCDGIPKVERPLGHLACAKTQQSADRRDASRLGKRNLN